jgi:hypothetical protein
MLIAGAAWMVVMLAQAPTTGAASQALPVSDARDGMTAAVDVRNEVGKKLRLVEATLILDDKELAHRTAPRGGELDPSFRLWSSGEAPVNGSEHVSIDGMLRPGEHAVTVALVYEARNVGPFTYLEGYRYRAEQTFGFTVGSGNRPVTLEVTAQERKAAKGPLPVEPVVSIQPGPGSRIVPVTVGTGQRL